MSIARAAVSPYCCIAIASSVRFGITVSPHHRIAVLPLQVVQGLVSLYHRIAVCIAMAISVRSGITVSLYHCIAVLPLQVV